MKYLFLFIFSISSVAYPQTVTIKEIKRKANPDYLDKNESDSATYYRAIEEVDRILY
jgi:hypothetical protein